MDLSPSVPDDATVRPAAYTKAHKASALGVSADLLREKSAVNEDVVTQLATGALQRSPASLSLAVSGVLGPEEDEDANPVGLVYFCAMQRDSAPLVVREDWGKQPPEQLLRFTINRAFDLVETTIKHSQIGITADASDAPPGQVNYEPPARPGHQT
jgi:PncC family amidohydrolase